MTSTTNDDNSSSPHRPDPAAVKAAKRNILVWLQLNDEERSRRRIADEIGVLFDALAARDEASEALRSLCEDASTLIIAMPNIPQRNDWLKRADELLARLLLSVAAEAGHEEERTIDED